MSMPVITGGITWALTECTVHALGLVPASTLPYGGVLADKSPRAFIVEYTLLGVFFGKKLNPS